MRDWAEIERIERKGDGGNERKGGEILRCRGEVFQENIFSVVAGH